MQFVTPIATNPVAGSRLIIGGNATVYESTDQGNTVAQIDTNGANQIAKTPLDNYGGPTRTRALILNSPARNTSVGNAATGDQRGFPIVGIADIGSYEAGTLTNYNAYIWETLPGSATVAQHAASFDFDGDGAINGNEFIALTNAANPASLFRVLGLVRNGTSIDLTYTTEVGRNYTFEYTGDLLTPWIPIPGTIPGIGSPIITPVGPVTGFDEFFIRVRVGP